jgi:hypothetical protein
VVELGSAPPVRGTRPRNCILVGLTISSEEIAPLYEIECLREGQANISLFLDTGLPVVALLLANTDLPNSIDGFRPVSSSVELIELILPKRTSPSSVFFVELAPCMWLWPDHPAGDPQIFPTYKR